MPYHGKDHNDYVNGAGFCCAGNEEYEKMQYYYHADHLGSSSYITNLDAQIVQHVEYVPFGEVFIEERNQSWNTPYLFNGKELDEETGLYYYGARYYNPRESVWLSTDPLAEKYPGTSAYAYVANNPINAIDPDGRSPYPPIYRERNSMLGKSEIKFYNSNPQVVVYRGINYGGDDPGNSFQGYEGYILANDMKTKLNVFKPLTIYNQYENEYRPLNGSEGHTNCYGDVLTNGEYIVMEENPQVIMSFLLADGYKSIPLSSDFQSGDIMMDNNGGHMMQAIGRYESGKNKGKMMWRSYWASDKPVVGTLGEITDYNNKNNNGQSRSQHNSSNTRLFRPTQGDIVNEHGHITEEPRPINTKYKYESL